MNEALWFVPWMDTADRHDGQRDKQTDGRIETCLFVCIPSVHSLIRLIWSLTRCACPSHKAL